MRIFVCGIATETNSFSPIFIGLDDFKASLYAEPYTHPQTPTLCTAALVELRNRAQQEAFSLVEGSTSWADPGGLVSQDCYEYLRDEILEQLTIAHAVEPIDGVILCLHGAMMAQGYDDPEGDLMEHIRAIVGQGATIGASLDPHSHLSDKRVKNADILCAFKEFPHSDFVQIGKQLVDLVIKSIKGDIKPKMAVYDCKMIDIFPTTRQPMRQFVDDLYQQEQQKKVLSLSLIHGFMAGDSPSLGTKMVAICDNDLPQAEQLAQDFGQKIINIRGKSMPEILTEKQAVKRALEKLKHSNKPVTITDVWDNPGGGVAGDATVILKAFIDANLNLSEIKIALGTIWDPIAVNHCFKAGQGARIPLCFGAKSAPDTGPLICGQVLVKKLNQSATQSFGSYQVPMGASVLIDYMGIDIILNSTRAQAFEPDLFNNMGVDPISKDILLIKSTNHFYDGFSKISDEIIFCDAGKPYPNNPKITNFVKAPKDIWPLKENPWQ